MEKAKRARPRDSIKIGGQEIQRGGRVTLEIPIAQLYTHNPITLPVQVLHGRRDGSRLFVSAAIHGDELNGVEIIRRLLKVITAGKLRGTLIAVPIVNVHGFIHHSRYLPDRRDLNRSFPGSERGSLAARLANLFLEEIVDKCTHGIDLHTAARHRENLPQIRANLDDAETAELARVFDVPVLLNSQLRDGSLREVAAERGIPMLLYEAGEALRFDELCVRAGVRGILSVMRKLGMLAGRGAKPRYEPTVARSSLWVRAEKSGIFRATTRLGGRVRKGDVLGWLDDPFGEQEVEVTATASGIVIGRTNLPLVNEGEALFHIARFESPRAVEAAVEEFQVAENGDDPLLDEPPVV